MVFHSYRDKRPFGAVPAGEAVTFRLRPARKLGVTRCTLLLFCEGEQHALAMPWEEAELERDVYSITHVFQTGLYFYAFSLKTAEGLRYVVKKANGESALATELSACFQQTVYDGTYTVPEWFGQGITYQIFPDRFCRSRVPEEGGYIFPRKIHKNWEDTPDYQPNEEGIITNHDFFGGDFQGIMEKLPYLKQLHVSTIYLNPIVLSPSNHRYDTADYERTDELLGSNEEFSALCAAAGKHGIRIVVDGVFSHTGRESRYFKGGKLSSVGAYDDKQSPYYPWYEFYRWPSEYSAWWGIDTLPQVREMEPSYLAYIAVGENSIVKRWLRAGASGIRLDVADELPDEFIRSVNRAAKAEKKEAVLLGEVWEDASNKISYGVRREYLLGGELDSVMNYPLKDAIFSYVKGGPAEAFAETVSDLMEHYPAPVFYNLMNLIGTHDTPRALTVFSCEEAAFSAAKECKAAFVPSEQQQRQGEKRLYMASILQFAMPGSPCIYYGDEAGMFGFEDPLNRKTYPWGKENPRILAHYRKLCAVYSQSDALKKGKFRIVFAKKEILIFERRHNDDIITVIMNNGAVCANVELPVSNGVCLLTGEEWNGQDRIRLKVEGGTARMIRCR